MTFNLQPVNDEYINREESALKTKKKVPCLLVANMTQNKWNHLPKVEVEIPRTHKQLTTYEPPRGVGTVSKPSTAKANKRQNLKNSKYLL